MIFVISLKCLYGVKNSDFIFFNTIEVIQIIINQKMKCTFRDIEVQSCPFGIVSRYKIRKEWDRIYGADDVCRYIKHEIHCCYA